MKRALSSTYRLQFNSDFTFDHAAKVVDYLKELGISHVYSSPYLQTAPGSNHGYDVADFKAVNQDLGGARAQEEFSRHLAAIGLGQILDIVPNHMSISQNNPYWRDVLENGKAGRYAEYFDIDWETREERLRNKVLLPLLGDQYGLVLASGGIKLVRTGARFEIVCDAASLPVAPSSMSRVLSTAAKALPSETLGFFADSLADLELPVEDDRAARLRARRDKTVLLSLLTRYLSERPEAMAAIDEAIDSINSNTDALDEFLQRQHYRLAYWKAANQDLGYRRFFDVDSLIGVRVEDREVFLDTHELILQWLRSGMIDGVRVDHADGLRDPQIYFEWLRKEAPNAWIVTEKILARHELLRDEWPVAGTTGYETLNMMNGLFVSRKGLAELDAIYQRVIGNAANYSCLVHDKKLSVMAEALGSDINRLSSLFVEICEADRDHRDHSRADIRHAIREVAACFNVYRTYISPERNLVTELDRLTVEAAIDAANENRTDIDRSLFDFIADVLLLRRRGRSESEFLLQFQQFTSPVMAKGFEDTVLYCYNRLVAVNEVGSDPLAPEVSIGEFHHSNQQAQHAHPERMVTLMTHDTKRSEDVRARLLVLSEVPQEFSAALARWFEMNSIYRRYNFPDANTEYLYYQTLIGAWPLSVDRALAYMEKATREAKQQTSWTQKNARFDGQLQQFIRSTLSDAKFMADMESFVQSINLAGRYNSLAQTLIKLTIPGIPDMYQGSELWDHRLVDPDNRGAIDFEKRRHLLAEMQTLTPCEILKQMESGLPKLWTIQKALTVREQHRDCFGRSGEYSPLRVEGRKSQHIVAFQRGDHVATIVPRLTAKIRNDWEDTKAILPTGKWTNTLTEEVTMGGPVSMANLFAKFPVALLTKEL